MPGSLSVRWLVFVVCGALTAFGCTADTQGESGSLSLELVINGDTEIDEVQWSITRGGEEIKSGVINTSANGATASVEAYGLEPGDGYTITLEAVSTDKETTCKGSTMFDIKVAEVTEVRVTMNCKLPPQYGGVRVNGEFNICPYINWADVSPMTTSVGNDIDLSAMAKDDDEGDTITYMWSSGSGIIADPMAQSTTYTCTEVGTDTITILVTDDGGIYCMDMVDFDVTCVAGDGDPCDKLVCEDTGNECTTAACNPGTAECETSNVADNTDCDGGAGMCMGGECVPKDLCMDTVCVDDGNECTTAACNPGSGECETSNVADGTPCGDGGACMGGTCIEEDPCETTTCDDTMNDCTVEVCNSQTGMCDLMNVPDQTTCNDDTGVCVGGVCEVGDECVDDNCDSGNDCVDGGTCNPSNGLCEGGGDEPINTPCDTDGVCDGAGTCVECNDGTQCPDDANECTTASCDLNTCGQANVMNGMVCDLLGVDDGMCEDGTCVAVPACTPETAEVDCDDMDDCTINTCPDGMCVSQSEEDGVDCDADGTPGTCQSGVCIETICAVDGDCDDANQCTDDTCDTSVSGGACVNANNDANACDTCAGGTCECSGGSCNDVAAAANVCEQFNPAPAQTGQNCDGSAGQECICEKAEFLAIDCDLLGNSAALPIAASAQQFAPAFAGTPVNLFIQDAVVLPATLVCGFTTAAGFTDAEVLNSEATIDISNATPASVLLSSFLHDQCGGSGCDTDADCALGEGVCDLTQPKPAPNTALGTCLPTANCDPVTGSPIRSLHGATFFDFPLACGFGCVGGVCQADTSVSCTDFNDCLAFEGTGPGIVAPFLPNSPGAIPPGVLPSVVTPLVAGTMDVTTPYSGIAFNLANLTAPGTFIPGACIGGACPSSICASITRGTTVGPRIMYDAICNKIQFAGGACTPFEFYADTNDVCIGRFDGTFQEAIDLPCCDIGTFGGPDFDPDCVSAANVASCCTALASDWPDATPAQQPQVPVN